LACSLRGDSLKSAPEAGKALMPVPLEKISACGDIFWPVAYTHRKFSLTLDGWRRWDWQDDFRGDPPGLPDLDPVDDHQKWPGVPSCPA
jgi:hypothetical protein